MFVLLTLAALPSPAPGRVNPPPDSYRVRLSSGRIDLVFADGSVLSTPEMFEGRDMHEITATGGIARDLLCEAREQFRLGLISPADLPRAFSLEQNDPNPFNPRTRIRYSLAAQAGVLPVRLTVFDLHGQALCTLVNRRQAPGLYSVVWDGCDNLGLPLPGGVYLYRLRAGAFCATRLMVLLDQPTAPQAP